MIVASVYTGCITYLIVSLGMGRQIPLSTTEVSCQPVVAFINAVLIETFYCLLAAWICCQAE